MQQLCRIFLFSGQCRLTISFSNDSLGHLHRKARHTRRHLSQRRLHSLKVASQQLPSLPPDPARLEAPRYRGWRCQTELKTADEGEGPVGYWSHKGCRVSAQEERCRVYQGNWLVPGRAYRQSSAQRWWRDQRRRQEHPYRDWQRGHPLSRPRDRREARYH